MQLKAQLLADTEFANQNERDPRCALTFQSVTDGHVELIERVERVSDIYSFARVEAD